jgi:transcriptional regulator with XRE-family HTH domain
MGNTPSLAFNRVAAALIGARIKEQRVKARLTMDELCRRAGLAAALGQGKQRIYAIENATRAEGVRIGTLYALAMALDIPVAKLLPTSEEVMEKSGVEFKWDESLRAAS